MATYSEITTLTLLTGAIDPEGDPITVRRVDGTVPSTWPTSVSLPTGTVLVYEDGAVIFDDGGSTSGHPQVGLELSNGTFEFTLWDGQNESSSYTCSVQLNGVVGGDVYQIGLAMDFDAAQGLALSGSDITSWTDQIGGLVATTPGAPQVGTSNGADTVVVGDGDHLSVSLPSGLPSGTASRTMIVAMQFDGTLEAYGGFAYGGSGDDQAFIISVDNQGRLLGDRKGADNAITALDVSGQWVIAIMTYDGTTQSLRIGNTEVGSEAALINTGADVLHIFRSFSGNTTTGQLGRALIYDRVLNDSQITQTVNALRETYIGSTIPSAPTDLVASNITSVGFDISGTSASHGYTHWAVTTSATPPSVSELKAGTGALISGVVTHEGSDAFNATVSGATASTAYYVHALFDDLTGGQSSIASSSSITTAAVDTTAPVLSGSSAAKAGSNGASGSVTTDEDNGTLYSVFTTSATAPSAAQVKAGQDHTGATVSAKPAYTVTATGAIDRAMTGLSAAVTYYRYDMHEDAAGNQSAVLSSAAFTTDAASTTTPEMYATLNGVISGQGDWAFVPNIQAANYNPPAHNKTCNPSTFNTVFAGRADGDVIRLEDGDYTGSTFEIVSEDFASGIEFVSQSYKGATFGNISLYDTSNVTVRGVQLTGSLQAHRNNGMTVDYCFGPFLFLETKGRTGVHTYNGSSVTTKGQNPTVSNCIFDRAWPATTQGNTSSYVNTAIIGRHNNLQMSNTIIMRGTEDCFKYNFLTSATITECLVYGAKTLSTHATADDIHPDMAQSFASSGEPNSTATISYSATVGTDLSGGYTGAQGWFFKDGPHDNFLWEQCIGQSNLNGNGFAGHNVHSNSVWRNCSTMGSIRVSGASNLVQNCMGQFAPYSADGPSAGDTGNVEFQWGSAGDIFSGSDPYQVDDYAPKSAYASKGAYDLVARIQSRRSAAGF